jgi:hypothetical protein
MKDLGKKVSNEVSRPTPQNPLQSDKKIVDHSKYVESQINHAPAAAFGYGLMPTDANGHRLMHHSRTCY